MTNLTTAYCKLDFGSNELEIMHIQNRHTIALTKFIFTFNVTFN